MVYTLRFFSSKCSLFHNSNVFGSCIIHILYTGCAKLKKKSGAKSLRRCSDMCLERATYQQNAADRIVAVGPRVAAGKSGMRRRGRCNAHCSESAHITAPV